MQTDAEHQQDDADFGQLRCKGLIGDEARRRRPDHHAGEQITGDRRDPQAVGERTENEGENEADDDRGNERRVVRHGNPGTGGNDVSVSVTARF
jgi:hypothetical protein